MDNNTEVFENNTTETTAETTTVETTANETTATDNYGEFSHYQDNTANIPYQAPVDDTPVTTNGLQIAGLVCGILSIVSCWCYGIFGIIFGIVGLVCAIVGNKKGKTGVGTAGLVCSVIGLILSVIALVYYIVVIGAAVSMMGSMDMSELESMMEMYGY